MDSEQTEREKYIENLQKEISRKVVTKRFKESDEGKMIQDWAVQQINSLVQNIGGKKYINDHSSYVFDTGQMFMAQKLMTMLNANTDTTEDAEKLKAAKSDG